MIVFVLASEVWWAREELNLRPLPCQIQRASAGLYVGGLEIGKDHKDAAGERRYQRPAAPTIRHDPPTVMLVRTSVGCCPSAARRANPDLRTTIRIACSHDPSRLSWTAGDAWIRLTLTDRWRPLLPL